MIKFKIFNYWVRQRSLANAGNWPGMKEKNAIKITGEPWRSRWCLKWSCSSSAIEFCFWMVLKLLDEHERLNIYLVLHQFAGVSVGNGTKPLRMRPLKMLYVIDSLVNEVFQQSHVFRRDVVERNHYIWTTVGNALKKNVHFCPNPSEFLGILPRHVQKSIYFTAEVRRQLITSEAHCWVLNGSQAVLIQWEILS